MSKGFRAEFAVSRHGARTLDDAGLLSDHVGRTCVKLSNTLTSQITSCLTKSVLSGHVEGLSAGLLLVARHNADRAIHQAATAFYADVDAELKSL